MPIELDSVVPWGRRFDEYVAMFGLTDVDLSGRILGCGDGPASFNAEARQRGLDVVSVDPIYAFSTREITRRIDSIFDDVVRQVGENSADFTWGRGVDDVEDLATKRRTAMDRFLADFDRGKSEGRYRTGELPHLEFDGGRFDLALCSHFLFLYSHQLTADFHVSAMVELCRIANEVRVFPLLNLAGATSPHLATVQASLADHGIDTHLTTVGYEFQRGGDQQLIASARN